MFENICKKNSDYKIIPVHDGDFSKYGKILDRSDIKGSEFKKLGARALELVVMPETGTEYKRAVDELEEGEFKSVIETSLYGGMPVQIGWCIGKNSKLNSFEYHKGNEILVAVTDLILILGEMKDIVNGKYDVSKIEIFYVPKETVLELYSTTLHFAPVAVDASGFISIIILPEGTNSPLDCKGDGTLCEEESMLWMRNKWLIAHPESPQAEKGAFVGLQGENIEIKF